MPMHRGTVIPFDFNVRVEAHFRVLVDQRKGVGTWYTFKVRDSNRYHDKFDSHIINGWQKGMSARKTALHWLNKDFPDET